MFLGGIVCVDCDWRVRAGSSEPARTDCGRFPAVHARAANRNFTLWIVYIQNAKLCHLPESFLFPLSTFSLLVPDER
jgi:hypothetical protein